MKLNFKKFGEGKPLIVLHGLMGMLDNWKTPAKTLAEHFEVYIVDQRNHGHSPHSDEFSYQFMMEDLLEFVEDHELHHAHFLGHSMGGKTAMKFAQNYPEYIDKLIVADIAPKAYEVHHQQILEGLLAVDLNTTKSRKEAETVLSNFIQETGVRQFLLKNLYWIEKGKLAWRFNLNTINRVIGDIGEEINDSMYEGETLFIRGGKSNYIQDIDKEMINTYFPQGGIETIASAGHWLHAEQPESFLKSVLKFLND
jgi:esterase